MNHKATTTPEEIKQNMQEIGARIMQAFERITISVEVLRHAPLTPGGSILSSEDCDFYEFILHEKHWHQVEGLTNTKSYNDLCSLWNAVKQVKDGVENDLQEMYRYVDLYTLAQAARLEKAKIQSTSLQVAFEPEILPPTEFVMPQPTGETDGEYIEPKEKPKTRTKGEIVDPVDDEDEESDEEEGDDEGDVEDDQ